VSQPSADSARPGAGPGTDLAAHRFASFDGAELAWHETGAGRPLVLLHGLFASGAQLADWTPSWRPTRASCGRSRPRC
jgi:pimeloyl-ACP methyl ester carboxylesterase